MARPDDAPPPFPPALRDAILAWYDASGREIPFRGVTDPYAILVSEAMAQQTQVMRATCSGPGRVGDLPPVMVVPAMPDDQCDDRAMRVACCRRRCRVTVRDRHVKDRAAADDVPLMLASRRGSRLETVPVHLSLASFARPR